MRDAWVFLDFLPEVLPLILQELLDWGSEASPHPLASPLQTGDGGQGGGALWNCSPPAPQFPPRITRPPALPRINARTWVEMESQSSELALCLSFPKGREKEGGNSCSKVGSDGVPEGPLPS